jgi:predicted RNase H-like HicB family nuclease
VADTKALTFNAVFEDAGDGWVYVHVPELPEVQTQGRDLDEAREMVRDAIELVLEERVPVASRIPSPAGQSWSGSKSRFDESRSGEAVAARDATLSLTMTAKEKLRKAVEELSEAEAAEALELITRRSGRDALDELLDSAPIDDEPETDEERAAVSEARKEVRRGETVSLEEIRRELP